jgi:hypothetical protein
MRLWLIVFVVLAVAEVGHAQPRTPWGDPDLQGVWSNATLTPLERPDAQSDKTFLTEAEAAEIDRTGLERTLKPLQPEVQASGELNATWLELGTVVRSRRTSLIVDPPDGKLPYTPEGKKRRDLANARVFQLVPVNSWEDRTMAERCLGTEGVMIPNPFYLNNHQIFQTRDYVAIVTEVMHMVRIIPLDRRPAPAEGVGQWLGLSRGHWEGKTLVVETTNFNDKGLFRAATPGLRLVERFTRVDADTIDYQLTVTDPATFTRPWTMVNTMRTKAGVIYEYGCHEGNYGMVNILTNARARDKH